MSVIRPKPRRANLRLEVITSDVRLQLRDYPHGWHFDEEYVERLRDLLTGGVELDPLEVVEEDRGKGKEPLYWLIDGFNRTEALGREKVASADCLIFPGTFADAQFWALASNSKHGKPRTPDDCKKAFERLMSSAVMLDRVIKDRGKFQGTERAIAAACGLSHGVVGKYLRERNLRVERLTGKLIAADGPVSPERDARIELVAECRAKGMTQEETAAELGISDHAVRNYERAAAAGNHAPTKPPAPAKTGRSNLARAGEDSGPARTPARAGENRPTAPTPDPEPTSAPAEDSAPPTPAPADARKAKAVEAMLANPTAAAEATAEQIVKDLAKLAEKVDEVSRSGLRDRLERIAQANLVPFVLAEVDTKPLIPRAGDSLKKVVRSWPALATIQTVFAHLVADLAMGDFEQERD